MRERQVLARLIAALLLLVPLAVALGGSVRAIVRLVPDDAFYYLEIARRISVGDGSTFDGIHPTNGYHPLWLALLVPLGPLLDADRALGLRLAFTSSIACMAVALWLLDRVLVRTSPASAWLGLLWAAVALVPASIYGMEAPLALAVLAAVLRWRITAGDAVRDGLIGGLLSGSLVLARLDAVVYVVVLDALWLVDAVHDPRKRRTLAAAVGVQAALIGGSLLGNLAWFGHPVPLSALIKAGRHANPNLAWAKSLLALLAVASAGIGALALLVRPGPVVRLAALGAVAHVGLLALGGSAESYNWYFALPVLAGAVALPAVLDALPSHRVPRWLPSAAVGVAACGLVVVAGRGKLKPLGYFGLRVDRALWIAAHAPEEVVFADGDCGILGYLSERPFVNLDGLTNGHAYQEALRDDRLPEWLARTGVNAVALPASEPPVDGRVALPPWPSRWGHVREAHLVVEPWPVAGDPSHQLWRVVRVEAGPP